MHLPIQIRRKNSILQSFRSRKIQSIQAFKLRKKKNSHHSKNFNKQNINRKFSAEGGKSRFYQKSQSHWFKQIKKVDNLQVNLSNDFYRQQVPDATINKDVITQYMKLTQKRGELVPQKNLDFYRKICVQAKQKIMQNQFGDFDERKILKTYNQQRHLKSKGQKQGQKNFSLLHFFKKPKSSTKRLDQLSKARSQTLSRSSNLSQDHQTCYYITPVEKKSRSLSANFRKKASEIITSCRKLEKDKSINQCLKLFEKFSKEVDDKLVKKSLGVKKLYSIVNFDRS